MLVFLISYHTEHSCYEWPSPSFVFKLYAVTLIIGSTGIKISFLNDNCFEWSAAFTFNAAFKNIVDTGIVLKQELLAYRRLEHFIHTLRKDRRVTFSEGMEQVVT